MVNSTFIEKRILGIAFREGALDIKWYTKWLRENDKNVVTDKSHRVLERKKLKHHFVLKHAELFSQIKGQRNAWLTQTGRKIIQLAIEELNYSHKSAPCDIMRSLMYWYKK